MSDRVFSVATGLLATRSGGQAALFESMLLFGGLLLVIVLAVAVVLYVRRRINEEQPVDGGGLTLEELRQLRDTGKLTTAEYETLRRQALAALTHDATARSAR